MKGEKRIRREQRGNQTLTNLLTFQAANASAAWVGHNVFGGGRYG